MPEPFMNKPASMQLSALKAISSIIEVCQPRIVRWKGSIIEAAGKCGISSVDSNTLDDGLSSLSSEREKECSLEFLQR